MRVSFTVEGTPVPKARARTVRKGGRTWSFTPKKVAAWEKVVKAEAAKGEDLLKKLLDMDEGARRVGEVAVGTNYGIRRFTRSILFDEKIGGSVHMAVGRSIPESGGVNESGIHWDMIKDMRKGGEIYGNGKLVYKNGKFL